MWIGELSRRTGISVRMLRYYEGQGLLRPSRLSSGYRDYGEPEEQTVRRIRMLSIAGFKLEAIRQLLPCVRSDQLDFEPCAELRAILRRELQTLDDRINQLRESRRVLAGHLRGLA